MRKHSIRKWIHFDKSDIALIAILIAAGIARFWALDFGLPHTLCRPDESRIVNIAVKFGGGDFNPHFFSYPSLYPYTLFVLFGLYYVVGMILGTFSSVSDLILEFATDPSSFYLIDRIVVATLGTATVYTVYRVALKLFTKRIALVSSFFLALAYLHVRDSHFGVTDVPMTFLIMCSLLSILKCRNAHSMKGYALAGVFAGLAASTKYAGLLLFIPMSIVHFCNVSTENGRKIRDLLDRRIIVFGMALVSAFLIGTPFAVLDFSSFLSDFLSEMNHLGSGHRNIILDRGWWYHLRFSLYYGLGWPLLLVSTVGMLVMARTNLKNALILCSFPLIYYLCAGKGYTVFVRYVVPLVPFLCITAAVSTIHIAGLINDRLSPRVKTVLVWLLAAIIVAPSTCRIIKFDSLLTHKDNRLIAAEWVHANIPRGSSIYQSCSDAGKLQLNPGQFFIEKCQKYEAMITDGLNDETIRSMMPKSIEYLKTKMAYQEWTCDNEGGEFEFKGQGEGALPDYIIAEQSPLWDYSRPPPEVSELLTTSYKLLKTFYAIDIGEEENVFDQQDLFYVPFAGFKNVERPGPNIFIYAKEPGNY